MLSDIIPLQKTSFIKPSSYSSLVFESDSIYSLKIMYLVYLILRLSIDTLRGFLPEGEWPCQAILRCQYARRGASPWDKCHALDHAEYYRNSFMHFLISLQEISFCDSQRGLCDAVSRLGLCSEAALRSRTNMVESSIISTKVFSDLRRSLVSELRGVL